MRAAYALLERELLRFFRQPNRLIGAFGQPVIFWLLLGAAFHSSFKAPGIGDPDDFSLDDCSTQRNLSAAGLEQSARIGDRFRDQGITRARVYSSQWCRCRETASNLGGERRPGYERVRRTRAQFFLDQHMHEFAGAGFEPLACPDQRQSRRPGMHVRQHRAKRGRGHGDDQGGTTLQGFRQAGGVTEAVG